MISKNLEYHPKDGMCGTCQYNWKNCSDLDFASMTPISKGDRDGVVIVRCIEFKRIEE